jgi:hypothetical protein
VVLVHLDRGHAWYRIVLLVGTWIVVATLLELIGGVFGLLP